MPRRRYSPEEIERGLTTLILAGSSQEAAEATGIPDSTLREWKMDHRDQYDRLCKDLEPKVVDRIAAEAEGIVLRLAGIQHRIIDRVEATIDELKPAEAHAAARNMATASALYVDKHSSPLRERPSHVQQQTDIDGLINQMARRLGWDTTAVPNEAETPETTGQSTPTTARDELNAGTAPQHST